MSDTIFVEPDTLALADRSILETAAECPRKARAIELGRVLNTNYLMAVGNGVHDATSATITEYVDCRGQLGIGEIQDFYLQQLASARPDIQPEVIRAGKNIAYPLGKYLNDLHWENIRCWDGGRGDKSSQLAYDIEEFGMRATSELDLVHDTMSPEVLAVTDFKSGWKKWDHTAVADSFQFPMHVVLLARKFPDIKAVEVRIWNSRINNFTYPVLFKTDPKSLYNYTYRIRNAAAAYFKTRGKEPNDCEAWPLVEKCDSCPAAAICDCSKMPEGTPEERVDLIAALTARVTGLRKLAMQDVRSLGRDIVTTLGNCYGTDKPKQERRREMSVYQIKSSKSEEPDVPETGATDAV